MTCCPGNPTQPPRFFDGRRHWRIRSFAADVFPVAAGAGEANPAASKEGTAKSVIHIFLPGGMAHQETFDPKPLRPDRIPRRDSAASRRTSTASASTRR